MPHKDPADRRAYEARYRAKHRKRINARWRTWRLANAERIRAVDCLRKKVAVLEGKRRLLEAFNWRCVYCGAPLSPDTVTKDHITPQSAGGSNARSNIVASCFRCNRDKGDRTPEEWQPHKDFGGILANGTHPDDFGEEGRERGPSL